MLMLPLFLMLVFAAPPPADWGALSAIRRKTCTQTTPAKLATLVNISVAQAEVLTKLAFTEKKAIIMRPIGRGAPDLRSKGYSPKPLAIKWKTCNHVDEQIGAPVGCFGALVLFPPHQPVTWPINLVDRSIMANRIVQRAKEWKDAHTDKTVDWKNPNYVRFFSDAECPKDRPPALQCMELVGFSTEDRYVRDVKNERPFTGDLDLFDVTAADGGHLPSTDPGKRKIIYTMISEKGLDVLHPAHVDWDTQKYQNDDPEKYEYLENIRLPILDVHRERPQSSPKREALVKVRADCQVCEVWAQPHPNDPYAKAAAKQAGAWKYPCLVKNKNPSTVSPRAFNWNPETPEGPPPNLDDIPLAPLKYKVGKKLYLKPTPSSPDQQCTAVTVTSSQRYPDGTGDYAFAYKSGGTGSDDAADLESRVCAGPPPAAQPASPPPAAQPASPPPPPPAIHVLPVGRALKIRPGPSSPPSECFAITITKVQQYNDGTAAYEFRNGGGGVSGDDAESLHSRICH